MDDYEIIDVHIHMVRTTEEASGHWPAQGRRARDWWAIPERVIPYMDQSGISKMCSMILVPRPQRAPLSEKPKLLELPEKQRLEGEKRISQQVAPLMREYNDWGCELGRRLPRVLPFISLSSELGDARAIVEELVLRVSQGAKGVKLHPGMFYLFPDDEVLWPMYEKCQELGLPVLSDSAPMAQQRALTVFPHGFKMPPANIEYGEPENFARVLEAFPRLTLILAHLGSGWWDERVELAQKYPNLYFDTSHGFSAPDRIPVSPHRGLAEADAVRIMRKIGVDRIMFGSDAPAIPFQPQLEQILRLPLSDEEKRMILSDNAKRILHI